MTSVRAGPGQGRAEQSRAEQSRAEQSRAEQAQAAPTQVCRDLTRSRTYTTGRTEQRTPHLGRSVKSHVNQHSGTKKIAHAFPDNCHSTWILRACSEFSLHFNIF